jgi:hypothetical protein
VTSPITALCDQLDQLRAAATPGEWHVAKGGLIDAGEYDIVISGGQVDCMARCYGGVSTIEGDNLPADAALIVAAINALPQLTAALRAVEALHAPVEWHEEAEPGEGVFDPTKPLTPFCHECTDDEYVDAIEFGDPIDLSSDVVSWPCPTVTAITEALQ